MWCDGKVNRIYIKLPDELYILGGDDNVGLSDQFLESLLISEQIVYSSLRIGVRAMLGCCPPASWAPDAERHVLL